MEMKKGQSKPWLAFTACRKEKAAGEGGMGMGAREREKASRPRAEKKERVGVWASARTRRAGHGSKPGRKPTREMRGRPGLHAGGSMATSCRK